MICFSIYRLVIAMHEKIKTSVLDKKFFENIFRLSEQIGCPVTVFDLETTSGLNTSNFGITEIAMLVFKDRKIYELQSLINPENRISPEVVRKTGITQAIVNAERNWRDSGVAAIFARAMKNHLVVGFNNKSFDCPAIIHENHRYGLEPLTFHAILDVRDLHRDFTGGYRGRLEEILTAVGRPLPRTTGQWHRAGQDTLATAIILDHYIQALGTLNVMRRIKSETSANVFETAGPSAPDISLKPALKEGITYLPPREAILKVLEGRDQFSEADLLAQAGKLVGEHRTYPFTLSMVLSHLIEDPGFPRHKIRDDVAQGWLRENQHLEAALGAVGYGTHQRLKPLMAWLQGQGAPSGLSYVQLRIGLYELQDRRLAISDPGKHWRTRLLEHASKFEAALEEAIIAEQMALGTQKVRTVIDHSLGFSKEKFGIPEYVKLKDILGVFPFIVLEDAKYWGGQAAVTTQRLKSVYPTAVFHEQRLAKRQANTDLYPAWHSTRREMTEEHGLSLA